MSAAFEGTLMHGYDWQGQDVRGWHITEKLDGCRARWTGTELLTRTGRPIATPQHLLAALPRHTPLDIEVHAGRGQFETARQAVQLGRWTDDVKLVVFDAPSHTGAWAQRRAWLAAHIGTPLVPHYGEVKSLDALADILSAWQQLNAEGLMLNRANRAYTNGRTPDVLKVKSPAALRLHIQTEVAA